MNHNNEDGYDYKHSYFKHVFHMGLCCALPIVIILLLPIVYKFSPKVSEILGVMAPFICPLIMLLMLPMMFLKRKKGRCCEKEINRKNKKMQ
ncbi:hypothetical protein [Clostridium sp.]|uniref:hypothetical protein n=1 Tax=Clostridium sp. TaxID=1506 RepID=UPI0025C0056F|nr:hypothetical protein [Clostridium sp.]